MGLLLMYSMKDSVTSTEICPNDEQQQDEVVKMTYIIKVQLRFVCLHSHSGRGKSPGELLSLRSSTAQWKKLHRVDEGN